jgi:cell division protein ZapA
MKSIEVTILGQSYRLMCPDDGEAILRGAVQTVDQEMSAIRDAGKVKARERMAVLASLNLAYRLNDRTASADTSTSTSTSTTAARRPAAPPGDNAGADVSNRTVDALVRRIDAALGSDGRLL